MEAWHVARTMRVLELLAYAPLSAPQIAEAMGAHPRTTKRVLDQLVAEEYAMRSDDARHRYRPTMRLVALAGQVLAKTALVGQARPYLALASARTGATAELITPSYESVLCVLRCQPRGEVAGPAVMDLVDAQNCAGGKVLLAWRDRWRESVLGDALLERGARTSGERLSLDRELEAVRATGYAVGEDTLEDVHMVAAPVVESGEAVAALQLRAAVLGDDAAREVLGVARDLSDNLVALS